ncbi:hypothetical protein POVCU2_0043050 [Plasmodium ovale curtisi]|uniref:Uncharacterized protein n=1 Tax=Plasmodium ovale curtisi TaxID=864141 RepID=A0A1A8W403_PLAOA|nr:hypothetical protein POVCU2_0043050 [Plasmodium ovale curtisi]SBS97645.1 hypothetical protein POVCU1_039770 [Plasmodium ovale curtisi]
MMKNGWLKFLQVNKLGHFVELTLLRLKEKDGGVSNNNPIRPSPAGADSLEQQCHTGYREVIAKCAYYVMSDFKIPVWLDRNLHTVHQRPLTLLCFQPEAALKFLQHCSVPKLSQCYPLLSLNSNSCKPVKACSRTIK